MTKKESINEVLLAEQRVWDAIEETELTFNAFTREEIIDLIYRAMEEKENFKL